MSEAFKVRVSTLCERTGKSVERSVSLGQARELEQQLEEKREMAGKVRTFLQSMPKETSPDLIVMYRGKSVVLTNVSDKAEPTMMRLLNDLTGSDTFPKPEAKKRKKSGISNSAPSSETKSKTAQFGEAYSNNSK